MSRHHKYDGIAKGPEWERCRRQTFTRDAYRCQQCGKTGRLEAHHVKPISEGGTNDLENLVTLCRTDHVEAHRPKKSEPERAWQQLVTEMRDGVR